MVNPKYKFEHFNKIINFLYRQEEPKTSASISHNIVMNSLVVILLIVGFSMIWNKFQDSEFRAVVELDPTRWTILMDVSDEACWSPIRDQECPASPTSNNLWNSKLKRRSFEYFNLLKSDLKQFYWMGLKIKPSELKRAASAGATRLMLGLLYSRYEVWIDGQRIQSGDYLENDIPIAIDLTTERMQKNEPLYVAVAVYRDGKMLTIDSDWFVPQMGLYTSRMSDQQMRWIVFARDSRFYILFAVFLLFGLIFRSAAITKKVNVEYSAAATFSFIAAFFQFVSADSVFRFLGPDLYYSFLNSTLVAEFFAILCLGFAISRSRNSFLKIFNLMIPISFLIVFVISKIFHDNGELTEKSITHLTPLGYFLAGILCLLQFIALKINVSNSEKSVSRVVFLASMSLFFIFISIGFGIETMQSQAVESHWVRIFTIVPLFLLITSISETVRQGYQIIETTSISSFHQQTPLPDLVSGVILNLDLKSSEKLFRTGARKEAGGTIVSTVISQIWSQFVISGATVMQSSGDDLLLIFPENSLKEDPRVWFKALQRVHEELQIIARQLADTQPELATLKRLEFRAAISRGSVRPIWRTIGSTRVPSWVEAADKNVFVDTARLLDLERSMKHVYINNKDQEDGSVLIVDKNMDSDLDQIEGLSYFPIQGEGKHGQLYQGNLVIINSQPKGLQLVS